ncbi:hypothetical protein O181_004322 [Austropuccinia psidii MF-1]|uniref:Uncharacterized protein n=1 Tax=Austropuccinia psidii MF-1 TaxID=1389203 RepID=A0A9Q3GFP0_9BASI|nr:hypothetical protein [Austropuccinia psidii MF-1]
MAVHIESFLSHVSVTLQSLDLVGHVTSASRQRQSSHVSHENVTQSPNPFQHYLQGSGNYTSWCKEAHAYVPTPPSRCDSDTSPHLHPPTPYASTPLPLTILMLT